jgi:RNA polymerase sigma factor (sigma-70 family)
MQSKSSESLDIFLRSHREEFLAFACRRTSERADAEDIVQEAFARATLQASELRDTTKLRPWIFQTIRNLIVDHHRASGRRAKREQSGADLGNHPSVESTRLETRTCECVVGQLETLSPEYAQILKDVVLDEARVSELAKGNGEQANALHVRLHRARRALKNRLTAHCGTASYQDLRNCACADVGQCKSP